MLIMKSTRIILQVTGIVLNKLLALRILFGPKKLSAKEYPNEDKLEQFFYFY
jgi:hypothetical protein